MTPSPADAATARRTVSQRIERLLAGLERARRQPNRREIFHVRNALELVKLGQYPEAEEAALKAERAAPVPAVDAHRLDLNASFTVEQLRTQLAEALTSGG
jgi:hypothetical protein